MMKRTLGILVTSIVAASLAIAASSALAQDELRDKIFATGPSYRTWDLESDLGKETISQFHLPFSQTIPLGRSAELVAYGAFASTKLDFGNGEEGTLSGITDVRLKGIYHPMPGAQVSLGLNLPVGKQTLKQNDSDRELEVAQAMWSPILGFRTKRMGEGFDVELGAGYATPLSPTATLGLSVAYILRGEYDLFETDGATTTFKPGGEGSATLGVDFRPSEGTLLRLDLTGRTYGEDESNDTRVFNPGTQFEIDGMLARIAGPWSFALRGRNVSRSDDELLAESGDEVIRTAVTAAGALWGLGEAYYQVGPTVALGAQVEAASFGEATTVLSDGSTIGFGPGLRFGTADSRRMTIRALYLTGNAESDAIDLSGFDISLAAVVPF